jgi:hypothetical protein
MIERTDCRGRRDDEDNDDLGTARLRMKDNWTQDILVISLCLSLPLSELGRIHKEEVQEFLMSHTSSFLFDGRSAPEYAVDDIPRLAISKVGAGQQCPFPSIVPIRHGLPLIHIDFCFTR